MSKYAAVYSDVYSVFNATVWKNEAVPTYPENFTSPKDPEYIRVSVIGSGSSRLGSISGILIIEIFIPVGQGPIRAADIADKLDKYLAGQTVITTAGGNTQFYDSSLVMDGVDKANPLLYRARYSIPFHFYGV